MMEWLSTLSFHRFHTDPEDDTEESITKLHDAKMRITEMEKEKLLLDKDGGELLLEEDVNNDDDAEEEPVEKVARLGSSSSSR
jgi:hypothetical protein